MPLKVEVSKKHEGVYIVSPKGSLDSSTYQQLEQSMASILIPATKVLILNMEELTYISSMGVSVVLNAKKSLEKQGGSFMMTNLQPQIKVVFDIVKALPVIRVFESLEEADEYLTEMQRREIEKRKRS